MPPHNKKLSKTSSNEKQTEILANRYQVIKKLGSGSYGTVFLIKDLKKEVCENKVLKKILIGNLEPDETISAVGEARLLAKLQHPGIVKFYDSFISGEFFCIVTEFCEGGDLDVKLNHWKKAGKEVDQSLVITWFMQILLAVQYMHQRRVLHRDLKSSNIFLKNNMIKIGDFGISRILLSTNDIATTVTGTPYYMAPEILKHEGYNSKSDIWSLGVILYEMCTLKKPFGGESLVSVMFKIVSGEIPSLPGTFDRELKTIYNRMLVREPTSRLTASEILKTSYISQHLQNLKHDLLPTATHRTRATKEANDIAQALKVNKAPESRPMTPKEKLQQRKQQKADKEAELLKQVTVSAYEEGRRKFSKFKQKQSQVGVSFAPGDCDDDTLVNSVATYLDGNNEKEENNNVLHDTSSLSVVHLSKSSEPTHNEYNKPTHNECSEPTRYYTHCFGEDESESEGEDDFQSSIGDMVSSTVLSGDNDGDNNDGDNDDESSDIFDLTNVSDIPEDAALADTYYSTNADFEEDLSSSNDDDEKDDDEYGVLMGYMQDALDLTESAIDSTTCDNALSLSSGTSSLRLQKIESLKTECIRLLGQTTFERVYKYLNKTRFQSTCTVSEDIIMQHLRRMVGNIRDCFLVDQLLFLQKQNEICEQSL